MSEDPFWLGLPLQEIEAGVEAGDPRSLALMGALRLTGRAQGFEPVKGVELIARAAELGNAEACEALAAHAAEGRLRQRSWAEAFDLLQRAAELGEPRARRQLALLTSDAAAASEARSPAPGAGVWGRARSAIDVEPWLKAPIGVTISASPRVVVFEGLLNPEVCDWLIERARGRLDPAVVYGAAGGQEVSETRDNSNFILHPFEQDVVVALVRARIAAAAGSIPAHFENTSVLHYDVGQRFVRHVDFLDPAKPNFAEIVAREGQRVATALICLNEDFEGGETGFPHLGFMWKGRKGEGVFFWHLDAFGEGDPRTEHSGRPPTQGQKWILSQFIRDKSWALGPVS
jgi:hypothetical protein